MPEDISIIGFDNISLSAIYDPPLTTISQPTRLLGQTAAGIIIGKLNGEKRDDKVVFDGDLIIRGSTN